MGVLGFRSVSKRHDHSEAERNVSQRWLRFFAVAFILLEVVAAAPPPDQHELVIKVLASRAAHDPDAMVRAVAMQMLRSRAQHPQAILTLMSLLDSGAALSSDVRSLVVDAVIAAARKSWWGQKDRERICRVVTDEWVVSQENATRRDDTMLRSLAACIDQADRSGPTPAEVALVEYLMESRDVTSVTAVLRSRDVGPRLAEAFVKLIGSSSVHWRQCAAAIEFLQRGVEKHGNKEAAGALVTLLQDAHANMSGSMKATIQVALLSAAQQGNEQVLEVAKQALAAGEDAVLEQSLALDMVLRAAASGNDMALGIAATQLETGRAAAHKAQVFDVILKAAGDGSSVALKSAMAHVGGGECSSDRIPALHAAMRAASDGHSAAVEVVAAELMGGAGIVLERQLLKSLQRAAMSGSELALDLALERLGQLSSDSQRDLFDLLARRAQERPYSKAFSVLVTSAEHADPKVRTEAIKALDAVLAIDED